MKDDSIERIRPETYHKCNDEIRGGKPDPKSQKWLDEILSGNRLSYAYVRDGQFIGEISLVLDAGDPDYTIPGVRIYLSRLVVKKSCRGQGIGTALVDFVCKKAQELGFPEISVGVDKDNLIAMRLYRRMGFDCVLFDGEDEAGPYYKLLKILSNG